MAVILPNPVTINLTDMNGNTLPSEYFGGELQYSFSDHPTQKITKAKIKGTDTAFILWAGSDYDHIGDYKQSDVDNKLISLISGDPAGFIASLYTGVHASGLNSLSQTPAGF
jgi:hypothetical protein